MRYSSLSMMLLLLCGMATLTVFAKPARVADVIEVTAKMQLGVQRPQCFSIVEMYDSSYVSGTLDDTISSWTINWGDKSRNVEQTYEGKFPDIANHTYTRNGYFMITLKVITKLGAEDTDSFEIYLPGPVPSIAPIDKRDYCLGETIAFRNTSQYKRRDSSIWVWQYGDGMINSQYDTITFSNDTISHRYEKDSTYNIFLYQSYVFNVGNKPRRCVVVYPDTSYGEKLFSLRVIKCFQDAIEAPVSPKISVYPNPAHDFIHFGCAEKTSFSITNSMGQTVKTCFIEGEQIIDVRDLDPGIYLLQDAAHTYGLRLSIE